jgi:hypothetical protein
MPTETSEESTLGKIKDALQTFYPLIVSLVITPFIVVLNLPWIGLALGAVLFALKRTWWTCIFGLLNAMAIVAMMLACVVSWVTKNKSEANKTLHPTAVSVQFEFGLPSPPWMS